jgi:alpha/beta superfamily hydrolase
MPSSSKKERKFTLPESGSSSRIADSDSGLAVIITHPWGPLGGNMNNNVVLAIAVWFQRLNITTMRFNFCGSQIGRGDRQVDNVREAATFLLTGQHLNAKKSSSTSKSKQPEKESKPPTHIFLVGYSYGSIISASASVGIPQCLGTVMISPPLAVRHWLYMFKGNYHLDQARKRNLPLLMMIGSKDNFTSEDDFMDIVNMMNENTTTGAVLKDADHFFRGREKDLMDIIGKLSESTSSLSKTYKDRIQSQAERMNYCMQKSHALCDVTRFDLNSNRALVTKRLPTM